MRAAQTEHKGSRESSSQSPGQLPSRGERKGQRFAFSDHQQEFQRAFRVILSYKRKLMFGRNSCAHKAKRLD